MLIDIWLLIGYSVIIILLSIIVFIVSAIWPSLIGAPWVPASIATVRMMLDLANVNQDDTVMDLGSGDGRIIVMAAEEFGASSIGIEADPLRVLWSRNVIRRRGLKDKVKVVWGNFFTQSLVGATVIAVYQGHEINNQLRTKLAGELTPGTRVVSYSFPFDGWKPVKATKDPNIYLYVI
jgi:hypothetical protein